MHRFLFLFISIFIISNICAKSPHGDGFKLTCSQCHTTDNWTKMKPTGFDHNKTKFPLVGQHKMIGCKKCHPTLEFSKAKTECSDCHIDMHQQTLGRDCGRCHTPNSWIVNNTRQIHQQAGFDLVGAHATVDCNRCHTSASKLMFENIRIDCYSCHKVQYEATNHRADGFDTECVRCHSLTGVTWSSIGRGFDHGFYPLTGAHNTDCIKCHTTGEYRTKLSTDCKVCHATEYARAKAAFPGHTNNSKIGKYACSECHNNLSWNYVSFKQHDGWFGIYSGTHRGAWTNCTDCHNNDAAYVANCKKCHD